jgi:hypothetical protein
VEERHDLVMLEQGRFGRCRLGKVAHECSRWVSTGSVGVEISWLKRKVGGVAILSFSGMEIKIEVADEGAAFFFIIPDTENLDIFMPCNIIFAVFYIVLVKILFINSPNDAPLALRGPLPWRPFCSLQLSSVARPGIWGLAPIKERK